MSHPVTLRPGLTLGAFQLEAKLALGGMAEIWTASGAQGRVALKVLLPHFVKNPAFLAMFQDEVDIATCLQHVNIVRVAGSHKAQGHVFQSMELLEGFDLRRMLSHAARTGRRLPIALCLYVAREVAKALSYAHTRCGDDGRPLDIVHRDVSPHNVMICQDGQVKLLDFGIARAAERSSRTRTGVIKGKLAYMAPEQALAVGVTPQTDIFAAGVVLWEMLTVERLFVANSDAELVDRVVAASIPAVQSKNPEVPDDVARLLGRMLAQRAPDRPPSMEQVHQSLTRAMSVHYEPDQADRQALAQWVRTEGPTANPATQAQLSPQPDPISQDATLPGAQSGGQAVTATLARPASDDDTWAGELPTERPAQAQESRARNIPTLAIEAPRLPLGSVGRPPSEVARTLVDEPMHLHLDGPLPHVVAEPTPVTPSPTPATPSGTPATPAGRMNKVRPPTLDEIHRAVDNQATVEVEADPEIAKLAAHLFVPKPSAVVVQDRLPSGPDAQATLLLPQADAVVPSAQVSQSQEQATQLGPLVPERDPVVVKGTDGSGEYETLGRQRPVAIEIAGLASQETPAAAPVPPAASPLGWILPITTLVLAVVVIVLMFLLVLGR